MNVSAWRECKLGELLEIKHGFAFLGEYFADAGTHVVLTPGNFHDDGGFKSKGEKEKWYTGPVPVDYVLGAGDLVVAMTEQAEGLLGSSALVPCDGLYLHNQRLGRVLLRDARSIDKRFLYHLFNSRTVRQQIRASATGLKIRHTAPSRIAEVKVRVPPLPTQRRIAAILSAYDDLIENNTRRIAILEEMARRLYEEWFVRFRFPGHEKVKMVETVVGRVPRSWIVARVTDMADVVRGKSYKGTELRDEGGLPFVTLKCIARDGGFRYDGLKRFEGEYKEHHAVRAGDIVVAVTDMTQERRIVARAARVPTLDRECGVMSMDLVRVAPKAEIPAAYVYGFLRHSSFPDEVKNHANGANVLHLSADRVAEYRFALPDAILREAFATAVEPMDQQVDVLSRLNRVLRSSRDLLLPRLVSGELDVSKLDIDVADAVA